MRTSVPTRSLCAGILALSSVLGACSTPEAPTPEPLPEEMRESDTLVAPLYPATQEVDAPDFAIGTLDGARFSLGAHRGQVVVLNFWATWCAPCRDEIPAFVRLQRELGPEGLQLVGVSLDDADDETVRAFAEAMGIVYPVGIDDGTVEKQYGPLAIMPTTYVIDRSGKVRYYVPGSVTYDALRPTLRALLSEPAPL